jgi:hypothetical protein
MPNPPKRLPSGSPLLRTKLTLLTVALLGVIILTLMQRSLEHQVDAYLRANAQAVARQSQLFFAPAPQRAQLAQLAQTTAFLGDVQVRILDHEQQLLAAAGIEGRTDELTWVFQSVADAGPGQRVYTMIVVAPGRQRGEPAGPVSEQRALPPLVAASAPSAISVRRLPSPWGDHLIFESESVQGEFAGETRLAQLEQVQLNPGPGAAARSARGATGPGVVGLL